jgi:hypothetical protein
VLIDNTTQPCLRKTQEQFRNTRTVAKLRHDKTIEAIVYFARSPECGPEECIYVEEEIFAEGGIHRIEAQLRAETYWLRWWWLAHCYPLLQRQRLSTSVPAASGGLRLAVEKTLRLESTKRFPLFHRHHD